MLVCRDEILRRGGSLPRTGALLGSAGHLNRSSCSSGQAVTVMNHSVGMASRIQLVGLSLPVQECNSNLRDQHESWAVFLQSNLDGTDVGTNGLLGAHHPASPDTTGVMSEHA